MASTGLRGWLRWLQRLLGLVVLSASAVRADPPATLAFEEVRLPSLRILGQAAKAHTQGLELVGDKYYVTARREDVRPKRALLLRTDPAASEWDTWDITPEDTSGGVSTMDHPGGIQSDGDRLWIPLAESKRNSRSIIRAYQLTNILAGQRLTVDFEFPVSDHIGAVAVAADRQLIFGANWDTERIYVWDFRGQLQRVLTGDELKARGLGVVTGPEGRPGVAVQDWKFVGERFFVSGFFRGSGPTAVATESRWLWFTGFLTPEYECRAVTLPMLKGVMPAREGMAVSADRVYFLPEDLGASNRMFRVSLPDLLQHSSDR